ncbi:aminotransferase class IV [Tateyamaria sp.]|uniref:aminotransferase class IV n=1 Tax=Tateyamaria sp. TaxID=1929288 RepID=UPI003B21C2A5
MTDFANGAAFFDGRVVPLADAGLPLTDWGLTHSDIAYDVVPVWQGAFFRLEDYVDRFEASMAAARMDVGRDRSGIITALHQMVAATGMADAYVAMVAARGRNPVPGSRDPRDCINHFYAWCVPYVHIVSPKAAETGTSVWIAKSVRRIPQDSVNPRVKNYHWGDFTSGLFEAKDNGFETTMLLDHAGNVTEGPGFNVFAVFGNTVVTSDHCREHSELSGVGNMPIVRFS